MCLCWYFVGYIHVVYVVYEYSFVNVMDSNPTTRWPLTSGKCGSFTVVRWVERTGAPAMYLDGVI